MKNNSTELVFIIDKSGSMAGLEADTVGGINSVLTKQKEEEGEVYVSCVLFNQESEVIYDRVDIREIAPMTASDYHASGCTALLDAIGGAIKHIEMIHRYARAEDVPEQTVFVITTDGEENSSRRFTRAEIKSMIEEKRESCGWEFVFLAANIDAFTTADGMGIRHDRAAGYDHTCEGVERSYFAMNELLCYIRRPKYKVDMDLDAYMRGEEERD